MSDFEVPVTRIASIVDHPNADRLSVAKVEGMDYEMICGRDQYQVGDKVAYIPEGAVLPDSMIEEMGLTGRLAGKKANRVKAIRLRGILSQGLLYDMTDSCYGDSEIYPVGDDIAQDFDITKYEPEIPTNMSGEVEPATGKTIKFDVENIKKYPDVFKDGERVVFTEKLHGTFLHLGYDREHGYIVASKGLAEKGLQFKMNDENKAKNLYIRTAFESGLAKMLKDYVELDESYKAVYVLGEIVGPGVQDLKYGLSKKEIRVFDIFYVLADGTERGNMGYEAMKLNAGMMCAKTVPEIAKDVPYSKEAVEQYTNGKERVSGSEAHMQEGTVIRPMHERRDDMLGRVMLKSVSGDYLTRRGGTEHN